MDHVVVLQGNREHFERFNGELLVVGGQFTEGPALFPDGFCAGGEAADLPVDLWFYMASVRLERGLVVVLAPYSDGDRHARLLQENGSDCVHHVALRVLPDRMDEVACSWKGRGFVPLSPEPVEDTLLRQWFLANSAGQIIELIERRSGAATFTCHNIHRLRQTEIATRARPQGVNLC